MADNAKVVEAATLVVQPTTNAATRAVASQFLEEWTQTAAAWDFYAPWLAATLQSARANPSHVAVALLCLQMLQAKIRRELPSSSASTPSQTVLTNIREALSRVIFGPHQPPKALGQSACICFTALQVRTTPLSSLIPSLLSMCSSGNHSTAVISASLNILGELPLELESCGTHTTTATTVANELTLHWEAVFTLLSQHFFQMIPTVAAAQALNQWVTACRVTLSQLNHPPSSSVSSHPLLPRLVQLLSNADNTLSSEFVTALSLAFTAVLRQPADSCTPSRQAALQAIVDATHVHGFIGAPLQAVLFSESDNSGDDASHALVNLWTTLVSEDIDEIVAWPATGLLELGLHMQQTRKLHRRTRCLLMDAWLTINDVPVNERHVHWQAPLMRQITQTLLQALALPETFASWADDEAEQDEDESDFEEYRRLSTDVLIGCYRMLRVEFLRLGAAPFANGSQTSHSAREAALFGLMATAREVCSRLKSNIGKASQSIQKDQYETATVLAQVAHTLLISPSTVPDFLAATQCRFWGAYAAAWAQRNEEDVPALALAILKQLIVFLGRPSALVKTAAAQAMQSVLTVSATPLWKNPSTSAALWNSIQECFRLALTSYREEDVMVLVAQGCMRCVIKISDHNVRDTALVALTQTLVEHGHKALSMLPLDGKILSDHGRAALEAVPQYVHVLAAFIKFGQSDIDGSSCMGNALSQYGWPLLEASAQKMHAYETILESVLGAHLQLLRSAPELLATQLSSMIQDYFALFEARKNASALKCFASAVEAYGEREVSAFESLLSHVSKVFFAYISAEKPVHECTELVEAYFELCQMYLFFCPAAIVCCDVFPTIASCATECLLAARGERGSTRATLNFLCRLVSWRRLPLSAEARQAMETGSQSLDETIRAHGQRLMQICMDMIVGGPRMLWPVAGDVIFALLLASINWPVPESSTSCVARQWLESVTLSSASSANKGKAENAVRVYQETMAELLVLVQKANKAKAKMLLSDMALALNGQIPPATLE